ncbi:MAG TPA: uracil-DNA glycosylase [Armatimonadota bacterium]|jgi:DNA polymerase
MTRIELLQPIAEEASRCTRCGLAESRKNVVFGDGNPDTPMLLIGEGPGEQEDATGTPFVGRAGVLLDKALRENGITRKHIYICNIIKCRATLLEDGRVSNRPPRQEEVDACNPWLAQQIEIINPLVIVCVGRPAAELMIHKGFAITSERGKWFDSPYCRSITAVLHPAYILRQHGPAFDSSYGLLVGDLGAARRKVIELKKQPAAPAPSPTPLSLF